MKKLLAMILRLIGILIFIPLVILVSIIVAIGTLCSIIYYGEEFDIEKPLIPVEKLLTYFFRLAKKLEK